MVKLRPEKKHGNVGGSDSLPNIINHHRPKLYWGGLQPEGTWLNHVKLDISSSESKLLWPLGAARFWLRVNHEGQDYGPSKDTTVPEGIWGYR